MILIYYYLLNGIRLDLDLGYSWTGYEKDLNLPLTTLTFGISHTTHSLIWGNRLDRFTSCLTDNLSKFSYFSNSCIFAWL